MATKALILIDLQNEFLDTESGHFPISGSPRLELLERLQIVVPAFRDGDMLDDPAQSGKRVVIWVKSEYSGGLEGGQGKGEDDGLGLQDTDYNHFLDGTHTGSTPCCAPGSYGAEFYPPVEKLIDREKDYVITKNWFSAFKDTQLEKTLSRNGVEEVYFAGLMSNVCVLASITDYVRREPERRRKLHVLEDCLGYRRLKSHEKAMEKMKALTYDSQDQDEEAKTAVTCVQSTEFTKPLLYYVNGSIPSWRVMVALNEKDISFRGIRMKVMSRPKPTRQLDFLHLNPRGKAPIFVDYEATDASEPRTIINESLAILSYLEVYYPHHPLLPGTNSRSLYAQVLALVQESENLHNTYDALEDAFFHAKYRAADARDQKIFAEFVANERPALVKAVEEEIAFWEEYLSGGTETGGCDDARRSIRSLQRERRGGMFLAGTEGMTLADCAFYPIVAYMIHRGFTFTAQKGQTQGKEKGVDKWPALRAYVDLMEEQESVKGSVPEGWEKTGRVDIFRSN